MLSRNNKPHILVHVCCGPCAITVVQRLQQENMSVTGLFFNPNIQPLAEYLRRREAAADVFSRLNAPLLFADVLPKELQYWHADAKSPNSPNSVETQRKIPQAIDPAYWLQEVATPPENRCLRCWFSRIKYTALFCTRNGSYNGFTSTLLYSRYQDHPQLHSLGEEAALLAGVPFIYRDFREQWQEGITLSKTWEIYRQPYCGCLYSEYERYTKKLQQALKATTHLDPAHGVG